MRQGINATNIHFKSELQPVAAAQLLSRVLSSSLWQTQGQFHVAAGTWLLKLRPNKMWVQPPAPLHLLQESTSSP